MKWLLDAEQKYLDGLPVVKDPNRRRLIQIGLDAVQEEINLRRQQKKDEPPVPESPKPTQQKSATQSKEPEPVILTDVLIKEDAPTIEIMLADGTVKKMTAAQLRQDARDNFRDLLKSNFTIGTYHQSVQFLNCVRFLIGLYRLGNDILPHIALHRNFNYCGMLMQGRSIELYEEIKRLYEKHKDS